MTTHAPAVKVGQYRAKSADPGAEWVLVLKSEMGPGVMRYSISQTGSEHPRYGHERGVWWVEDVIKMVYPHVLRPMTLKEKVAHYEATLTRIAGYDLEDASVAHECRDALRRGRRNTHV